MEHLPKVKQVVPVPIGKTRVTTNDGEAYYIDGYITTHNVTYAVVVRLANGELLHLDISKLKAEAE